MHRDASCRGFLGHFQVKRRVVDEHHSVGSPLSHHFGGGAQESGYLAQVLRHLDKAHIGHAAVMHDRSGAGGARHHVAAEKAELRLPVDKPQRLD